MKEPKQSAEVDCQEDKSNKNKPKNNTKSRIRTTGVQEYGHIVKNMRQTLCSLCFVFC